ncbi:hypothetical protein RRG08_043957 [Elysia crispata]|uniref:Uncharacterized protein n=1 Tax=Elysia crispata TaxID=231223 RepID=A0AAE1CQJ5_9GAST|nr:hypothetical protein RRG08_043957 [Elysia crispata]
MDPTTSDLFLPRPEVDKNLLSVEIVYRAARQLIGCLSRCRWQSNPKTSRSEGREYRIISSERREQQVSLLAWSPSPSVLSSGWEPWLVDKY